MIDIDKYEGSTRGERYQNCIVSILGEIRDELKKDNSTVQDYDFSRLNTGEISHVHSLKVEDCTKEEIIEVPQNTVQRKKRVKKETLTKEV